jgi:recombination protein U
LQKEVNFKFQSELNNDMVKKNISKFANRGMELEKIINNSLISWLQNDKILVFKQATAIGIHKKQYFFRKNLGTVDYHGLFKKQYFCFEAKSTEGKALRLNNLTKHQLNYLKITNNHGAISFIIIYFKMFQQLFIVDYLLIKHFLTQNKKTINYPIIEKEGFKLSINNQIIMHLKEGLQYLMEKKPPIK